MHPSEQHFLCSLIHQRVFTGSQKRASLCSTEGHEPSRDTFYMVKSWLRGLLLQCRHKQDGQDCNFVCLFISSVFLCCSSKCKHCTRTQKLASSPCQSAESLEELRGERRKSLVAVGATPLLFSTLSCWQWNYQMGVFYCSVQRTPTPTSLFF